MLATPPAESACCSCWIEDSTAETCGWISADADDFTAWTFVLIFVSASCTADVPFLTMSTLLRP